MRARRPPGAPERCGCVRREQGVVPVDYRAGDVAARIRALVPGGADAVFDHVGGRGVTDSWRLIAPGGTLGLPGRLRKGSRFRWTTPAPATPHTPATTLEITSMVRQLRNQDCILWKGPAIGEGLRIGGRPH